MGYDLLGLSGKAAVVIGGTSGIGRAIGHGWTEAGAGVVPTSRRIAFFLASDAASFVTGEILVVDGGFLASGVNQ